MKTYENLSSGLSVCRYDSHFLYGMRNAAIQPAKIPSMLAGWEPARQQIISQTRCEASLFIAERFQGGVADHIWPRLEATKHGIGSPAAPLCLMLSQQSPL